VSVTIVGRNREAGDAVVASMRALAPQQEFAFVQSDSALLRNARPFAEQCVFVKAPGCKLSLNL
jgi:hypothetical protein